jgi:putative transcriptional regulator
MISHHPDPELLLDYASGALAEPMALSIACHASICGKCRDEVSHLEAVGGILIDESETAPVDATSLNTVMSRLDDPEIDEEPVEAAFDQETLAKIPGPLRHYLPESLKGLNWRRIGSKVGQYNLDLKIGPYKASLMKFKAGNPMPFHTHKGMEATLVLSGSYTDQNNRFKRGDFDLKDSSHKHQPSVDPGEDCYALVIMDAPVVLAGPISKFLNPFIKL